MFALLMVNIQGRLLFAYQTLIEKAPGPTCIFRTETRLSATLRYVLASLGLDMGVICDDGPLVLLRDSREAVPSVQAVYRLP